MLLLDFGCTQAVKTAMMSQNIKIKSHGIYTHKVWVYKTHTIHENIDCLSGEKFMFKKFRTFFPEYSRSIMI